MRSKLNLQGSTRRIADKLGMSRTTLSRLPLPHLPVPHLPLSRVSMSPMPMEWLDAGSWRLPSGKALAEFALQAGFLAPLLMKSDHFGGDHREPSVNSSPVSSADELVSTGAMKQFGKGNGR